MTLHRRDALKMAALSTLALVGRGLPRAEAAVAPAIAGTPAPDGRFVLPELGYDFAALEPHIDAGTMEIHHGKHHKAYVDNLNKALADYPDLSNKSLDDLLGDLKSVPEAIRSTVRNNGGGHANHTLFWKCIGKPGSQGPSGNLAEAVNSAFGGFDPMKEKLISAGKSVFGSGWVWLALDAQRKVIIETTPNQDTPVMEGRTPLLGLDVWEHAYYLHYQNRRADYLAACFNVIDWDFVSGRYASLTSGSKS